MKAKETSPARIDGVRIIEKLQEYLHIATEMEAEYKQKKDTHAAMYSAGCKSAYKRAIEVIEIQMNYVTPNNNDNDNEKETDRTECFNRTIENR